MRNLREARLEGVGRVNVLHGSNGSGKTSVLEAIHILGMARSFRGGSVKHLITHGEPHCTVFGSVFRAPAGALRLGVQRGRAGEAQIRVGGRQVRTVAELAETLPLQVITADSFDLLTGAPGSRRRFLDWGAFHVEHRFFEQWQRFQRGLRQRNMLLRRGNIAAGELAPWSRDLARYGAEITVFRRACFEALAPRFHSTLAQLAPELDGVSLHFRQGWDTELSYAEALEKGLATDRELGYTHAGPQRADIRVSIGGHAAAETLSRGQQKLVVCALKLAQGQLLAEQGNRECTYLIDDLPSELDREHSRRVCAHLEAMPAQVFITCVDEREIRGVWPGGGLTLFHVEQGAVSGPGAATA